MTLASGEKIPAMLSKHKIMRVAAKSKNAYQYDCKKGDAWEEWWKKTAVKNVLKYAPRSTALDKALIHDNELSPIDAQHEEVQPTAQLVQIEQPKRKSRLDKLKEAETPASVTVSDKTEPVLQNGDSMPEVPEFLKRQSSGATKAESQSEGCSDEVVDGLP